MLAAGLGTAVAALVGARFRLGEAAHVNVTPSGHWPQPVVGPDLHDDRGPVLVTIEYRIDPTRSTEFRALMIEGRRSRLSHGALSWELLHDINEPSRCVEMIVDESWNDHIRRFDRVTTADVALRDWKLAFHIGESPPVVTRSLMETTVKAG